LGHHHVILMPPDADDVLSKGYQLHIRSTSISKEDIDCIRPIVEARNLALSDESENHLLIIYKPVADKTRLLEVHSNK
jgi:hypothetical protein